GGVSAGVASADRHGPLTATQRVWPEPRPFSHRSDFMSRSTRSSQRTRLAVTRLEDRSTPSSTAATAAGPYAVGVPDGQTGDVVVHNADGSVDYTVPDPYGAGCPGRARVKSA